MPKTRPHSVKNLPDGDTQTIAHESGLEVHVFRSTIDGELVIDIDSTGLDDTGLDVVGDAEPKIRIFVNDARVFNHGEPVDPGDWV